MDLVEGTWGRAAQVWWAIAWRYLVFGWGISVAVALAVVFLVSPASLENDLAEAIAALVALPVHVVASLWAVQRVIGKDFGDFQLVLQESYLLHRLRELERGAGGEAAEGA